MILSLLNCKEEKSSAASVTYSSSKHKMYNLTYSSSRAETRSQAISFLWDIKDLIIRVLKFLNVRDDRALHNGNSFKWATAASSVSRALHT